MLWDYDQQIVQEKTQQPKQVPYHHCLALSQQISEKSFQLYTITDRHNASVSCSFPNQRPNLTASQQHGYMEHPGDGANHEAQE